MGREKPCPYGCGSLLTSGPLSLLKEKVGVRFFQAAQIQAIHDEWPKDIMPRIVNDMNEARERLSEQVLSANTLTEIEDAKKALRE